MEKINGKRTSSRNGQSHAGHSLPAEEDRHTRKGSSDSAVGAPDQGTVPDAHENSEGDGQHLSKTSAEGKSHQLPC